MSNDTPKRPGKSRMGRTRDKGMGVGFINPAAVSAYGGGKDTDIHANTRSQTSSADESPMADKWSRIQGEQYERTGGVSQPPSVGTGNVIPLRPTATSREDIPTLNLRTSGADASTEEGPSIAERIAGAETMIRDWELADDDSLVVLLERRGKCYAIAYYPPTVSLSAPAIAEHLLVIGANVATDAPPNLNIAGSIDQIILSGNAEELTTCDLGEIFGADPNLPEAQIPQRDGPEATAVSDDSTGDTLKKILPWAALAGALYVINEQF